MIIEQLQALLLVYTVMVLIVVYQVVSLSRLFKTWAWYLIAMGVVIAGALRIWGLLKLPTLIVKAQQQGEIGDRLTPEQWFSVALSLAVIGFLMAGFGVLKSDLRRVGAAKRKFEHDVFEK